ncbi:ISAzo13 family transposase, partial [Streptosporangium subroseum]
LRLRFRPPQSVLAELFGVVTGTIAKAERQIRPLLDRCGYIIEPAETRFTSLADLTAFAAAAGLPLTPKIKAAH